MDLAALLLELGVGLLLGSVLGLFGGGGGILAVPLLIALLGLSADEASTLSLIVVGLGAAAGLVPHARAGRVDWRTGLTVGALGVVGAVVGSRAALIVSDRLQLVLFSLLLLAAGAAMARATRARDRAESPERHAGAGSATDAASPAGVPTGVEPPPPGVRAAPARPGSPGGASWVAVVAVATGLGLVTGFFGVGGGFLVVPALVAVLRVPIRVATATGLLVIVINSAAAFAARWGVSVDWGLAVALVVPTAAAAVVAGGLSARVPARVLGYGFAALTVVMAVVTLVGAR